MKKFLTAAFGIILGLFGLAQTEQINGVDNAQSKKVVDLSNVNIDQFGKVTLPVSDYFEDLTNDEILSDGCCGGRDGCCADGKC
jgi:hypothetical protein